MPTQAETSRRPRVINRLKRVHNPFLYKIPIVVKHEGGHIAPTPYTTLSWGIHCGKKANCLHNLCLLRVHGGEKSKCLHEGRPPKVPTFGRKRSGCITSAILSSARWGEVKVPRSPELFKVPMVRRKQSGYRNPTLLGSLWWKETKAGV